MWPTSLASSLRPRLHEHVFIENGILLNENATTVLQIRIVFLSFSYRFQPSYTKTVKRLKTVKTSGNLLFACQDNLTNLWLLFYCFQNFAFSVKVIRLHDKDIIIAISFSNLSTWRLFSNVTVFSENDHRF